MTAPVSGLGTVPVSIIVLRKFIKVGPLVRLSLLLLRLKYPESFESCRYLLEVFFHISSNEDSHFLCTGRAAYLAAA